MIDVLTVQDIVYPILVAESLLMSGLLMLTYVWIDRAKAILYLSVFFLAMCMAFAILALVTGNAPMWDIDGFRSWIIKARIAMAILLLPCLYYQAMRIWRKK